MINRLVNIILRIREKFEEMLMNRSSQGYERQTLIPYLGPFGLPSEASHTIFNSEEPNDKEPSLFYIIFWAF
jgi:hypothetical protein